MFLFQGFFWSGPPYQILDAWRNKQIKLIVTHEIIEEYSRVSHLLAGKYPGVDITPFIELIVLHADMYEPVKLTKQISSDPDDDKFIACALSAETKIIVSGDSDLLEISGFQGITVLKPRAFVTEYLA
jgi:uncharacterized protein